MKRRAGQMDFSLSDRAFRVLNGLFLVIVCALVGWPIIYVLSASFSSAEAVTSGRVWLWPVDPTLAGYVAVYRVRSVWVGYGNSVLYATAGTAVNIVVTICAAYPLSRHELFGRRPLVWIFIFTMYFSGGMIPTYMLVRDLGMIDTRAAMIIPNALSVFNMIVMISYFRSAIPNDLHSAAAIDGCSELRFLVRIVIPLSGPIIAVLTLWYAVAHWNAFFLPLIYLRNQSLYPLQVVLRDILLSARYAAESDDVREMIAAQGMYDLLRHSLIVVASLPVIIIYPFVQRYFVQGIMLGAVKA